MKPIDAAWYSLKKQLPDHMVNLPPSQSVEGHYGFGGAQSPRPPGSPGDDPRLATLDPNDLDAQDPRMKKFKLNNLIYLHLTIHFLKVTITCCQGIIKKEKHCTKSIPTKQTLTIYGLIE